ncbi:aspartate carbamoyltransferase catalytic subunit [Candidatus Gracilibacteria bacterium]|nr:aspartate carbamoyltransferase catalytic subunit [Candidatus Gracilibacteria bacterium]
MTPEQELTKLRNNRDLSIFDLYSVDQLTITDLGVIFELARKFREYKTFKFSLNKGCSQINCFFESSTRTLASFDLAAKNLSMDTTSVGGSSSVNKGESYLDTAQTLDAYNARIIVIRSSQAGVAEVLSQNVGASILNAGDGWHEHPTQALLDALTMLDYFESETLKERTITIVGDVMHSRVFGSLVRLCNKLGANIRVCCPITLQPKYLEKFGVEVFTDIEIALKDSDVVYALRMQEERGAKGFIPSLREYSKSYGISKTRMPLAKPNAMLMHPGPVIRDIDIHSSLSAVDEQSHILKQVENGLAIRKTLLWLLAQRCDGKQKTFIRK